MEKTQSFPGDPVTGTGLSTGSLSGEFDSMQFPPLDVDYLCDDLMIPEGLMEELGFDEDFDFSLENLSFPLDNEPFSLEGSDVSSSTVSAAFQNSGDGSSGDVAEFLNCPTPESGSCDREAPEPVSSQDSAGCRAVVDGFSNVASPDSGANSQSGTVSAIGYSPKSGDVQSESVVVDVDEKKVKSEEEGGRDCCLLKRKKENEDESLKDSGRISKFRRGSQSENPSSTLDEEDKRKARLMRNRESAQLSRQRKKHYVEELEDKVRSMHAVIADLNSKISYFMTENANLRQRLSNGAVCAPPPGVYPPPPMASMPYPWIPCGYPMKPQGSQVPLVPIPKLKPHKTANKSESKKKEARTKKVASISFLGLLFFLFLFGVLVPLVKDKYGESGVVVPSGFGSIFSNSGINNRPNGRVLTVNSSHPIGRVGHHTGNSGLPPRRCTNGIHIEEREPKFRRKDEVPKQACTDGFVPLGNSSEPLAASLYVPRNDKLVKIDGNLIIQAVMASEKAKEFSREETGLAIPSNLHPALAISNDGRRHVYGSERQKALGSSSGDTYKSNSKANANEGSLQKWFREGLEGPILKSGMCTEVFQFETSPSSANSGAIVPVTSAPNISRTDSKNSTELSKRKNRRILDRLPIPLAELELNATGQHGARTTQDGSSNGSRSVSPMIVSVLFDPREAGDSESEGMITPKSLSRIFVVVLLDSVKYVTYSCVLPFKASNAPHLVTS